MRVWTPAGVRSHGSSTARGEADHVIGGSLSSAATNTCLTVSCSSATGSTSAASSSTWVPSLAGSAGGACNRSRSNASSSSQTRRLPSFYSRRRPQAAPAAPPANANTRLECRPAASGCLPSPDELRFSLGCSSSSSSSAQPPPLEVLTQTAVPACPTPVRRTEGVAADRPLRTPASGTRQSFYAGVRRWRGTATAVPSSSAEESGSAAAAASDQAALEASRSPPAVKEMGHGERPGGQPRRSWRPPAAPGHERESAMASERPAADEDDGDCFADAQSEADDGQRQSVLLPDASPSYSAQEAPEAPAAALVGRTKADAGDLEKAKGIADAGHSAPQEGKDGCGFFPPADPPLFLSDNEAEDEEEDDGDAQSVTEGGEKEKAICESPAKGMKGGSCGLAKAAWEPSRTEGSVAEADDEAANETEAKLRRSIRLRYLALVARRRLAEGGHTSVFNRCQDDFFPPADPPLFLSDGEDEVEDEQPEEMMPAPAKATDTSPKKASPADAALGIDDDNKAKLEALAAAAAAVKTGDEAAAKGLIADCLWLRLTTTSSRGPGGARARWVDSMEDSDEDPLPEASSLAGGPASEKERSRRKSLDSLLELCSPKEKRAPLQQPKQQAGRRGEKNPAEQADGSWRQRTAEADGGLRRSSSGASVVGGCGKTASWQPAAAWQRGGAWQDAAAWGGRSVKPPPNATCWNQWGWSDAAGRSKSAAPDWAASASAHRSGAQPRQSRRRRSRAQKRSAAAAVAGEAPVAVEG
eukprot:TRINITY_DN50618_c0_g1_i1.p1 TRINITY_DN50618_c0_g1~~TRINITY_DN50618_c0_g1_i1.p1  ORF type:complete len:757 (-),score=192.61 TRINITY_DN50618_c0_g1_i1:129-2399(-)